MAIFKRGKVYWYHFLWKGEHIQRSTKQGNPNVARDIAAAIRAALAKGEVGILERKPVPTLKEYQQRFFDNASIGCKRPPRDSTLGFYAAKFKHLLEFPLLANARLNEITEEMILQYVEKRRRVVSPAEVNRELATLRRVLHVAHRLKDIGSVPFITMLEGEKERTFVLSPEQEKNYLAAVPPLLHDVAILGLDSTLRLGEILHLKWSAINFQATEDFPYGSFTVLLGSKSRKPRTVPLTLRARLMLQARYEVVSSAWVFPDRTGQAPASRFTLKSQHARVRELLRLPSDFVAHGWRHTCLTRLGNNGTDIITLMKLAGHSSSKMTEKYCHSSDQSKGRAILSLESGKKALPELQPATNFATVEEVHIDSQQQVV